MPTPESLPQPSLQQEKERIQARLREQLAAFFDNQSPAFLDVLDRSLVNNLGSFLKLQKYIKVENRQIFKKIGVADHLDQIIEQQLMSSDYLMESLELIGLLQERPDFLDWLTVEKVKITNALYLQSPIDFLYQLLIDDQVGDLTQLTSFADFNRLIVVTMRNRLPTMINFACQYPHLIKPVGEVMTRRDWSQADWADRLLAFSEIRDILGTCSLVTDEDLTQLTWQLWQPTEPTEQALKSSFPTLQRSEQQTILSSLRNSLDNQQTKALRLLAADRLTPEEKDQRLQAKERQLQSIRLVEHPWHPWNYVSPYFGTEIETTPPKDGMGPLLEQMDAIGLHMGATGADFEISPGPFYSAVTAKAIMASWVDAQWLDLHRAYLQTCHMNAELEGRNRLNLINHLTISCSYAHHPSFISLAYRFIRLTYREKTSPVNKKSYQETKGFFYLNQPDFFKHLDTYSLLIKIAKAHQLIHLTPQMFLRDHQHYAVAMGISPYVYELAILWEDVKTEYLSILSTFGFNDYQKNDEYPTKFHGDKILDVFPTPKDHLDAEERLSFFDRKARRPRPSTMPNIVAASRNLVATTQAKIEGVLMQMQADFITKLVAFNEAHETNKPELIADFMRHFPFYRVLEGFEDEDLTDKARIEKLSAELLPLFKPFLEPGNTLPRPT